MRNELTHAIKVEKGNIDYTIRTELVDFISKTARIMFENDLVNDAKHLVETNEFTETQEVFERNLISIKEERVENIKNYLESFKTTVKIKVRSDISRFNEENCNERISRLSQYNNKEEVIKEMNEIANAKKCILDYSNKEIEKAIEIFEETTKAMINRI